MSSIIVSGGIEINGISRVSVSVATIKPYHQIVLKGVSRPIVGSIVLSEIINNVGFGLSSTSPTDIGTTVYFDVIEEYSARETWEKSTPITTIISNSE